MIKLIAAFAMLLDHISYVVRHNPNIYLLLRMIGRIAMPLYAYTVARGYAYSKAHGTTVKYIRNLAIFSAVSQLPFYLLRKKDGLNIGVTWLLAVFVLIGYDSFKKALSSTRFAREPQTPQEQPEETEHNGGNEKFFLGKYRFLRFLTPLLAILSCLMASELLKVDYGVSAILLCVMFYILEQKQDRSFRSYLFAVLLSCLIHLVIHQGSLLQVFAILSVPVLIWAQKWDNLIRLPKWFYYVFYPAHLAVLYAVSQFIG